MNIYNNKYKILLNLLDLNTRKENKNRNGIKRRTVKI